MVCFGLLFGLFDGVCGWFIVRCGGVLWWFVWLFMLVIRVGI